MSIPGVWKLIGTHIKSSCHCKQWRDSKSKCSYRITTCSSTLNCIYNGSCNSKDVSIPGVWKLVGTHVKRSCHCKQWRDSKSKCSYCITTCGQALNCISDCAC